MKKEKRKKIITNDIIATSETFFRSPWSPCITFVNRIFSRRDPPSSNRRYIVHRPFSFFSTKQTYTHVHIYIYIHTNGREGRGGLIRFDRVRSFHTLLNNCIQTRVVVSIVNFSRRFFLTKIYLFELHVIGYEIFSGNKIKFREVNFTDWIVVKKKESVTYNLYLVDRYFTPKKRPLKIYKIKEKKKRNLKIYLKFKKRSKRFYIYSSSRSWLESEYR